MRVLLVVPRSNDLLHNPSMPLGLVSIGTYLKRYQHEVKIIDMDVKKYSIKKVIDDFKPDICGISVRTQKQINSALRISEKCKKYNIPVVWGGSLTAMVKLEHFFDTECIDIVSLGEGEMTWLELVDVVAKRRSLEDVKGIAFKRNGEIVVTENREFLDLNEIYPCDWTLIDVPRYFQHLYGAQKLVYLYMSKGCPGHCAFCYNSYFHHSCVRRKSINVFMQELKNLVENYGVDGFYLADEIAFSKKTDLYDFCDALCKTEYQLIWGCETRIGILNRDDLQTLYDNGCVCIHFGIETASSEMIEKVGKNIPFDKIIPTFEMCNEIGIIPVSTFIIGLPGENVENLKTTVNFMKTLPSNELSVMQYGYLYNSDFGKELYNCGKYKLPQKLKEYKKVDLYNNRQPNYSDIPPKDLRVVQGHFFWRLLLKSDYQAYPNREQGFVVLKKHIKILLNRIWYTDIVDLPESICASAVPFIRFFLSAKFYKKTRSKYGL